MSLVKLVLGMVVVELERGARALIRAAVRRVTGDPPVATGRGLSYKDVQHQQAQIAAGARPFPEPTTDAIHPIVLPVRPRPPSGKR